ncbi:hypothetical protein AKJ16_DCAP04297 [Drosera capensis]
MPFSTASSFSSPRSLHFFSNSVNGRGKPVSFGFRVCAGSADVPDFLSADCLGSRRKRPLGPSLEFSAEDAVRHQLDALKYNDQPRADNGIEVMHRFAGFDPFERSTYFVLLGHKDRKLLSCLWVKERVWVQGNGPEEEEIFEFTIVQRLGGSWDGYWLTESLLHDRDSFSGGVAY